MSLVKDTKFCVTNWSAVDRKDWPSVVACAKQKGPIEWSWPKRYTPLSIKCLIKSSETYELPGRAVTVDPESFLIINEGTEYSSSISSMSDVETASVFLNSRIISEVHANLNRAHDKLVDGATDGAKQVQFVERLYPRDDSITPLLQRIHGLANAPSDEGQLTELLYLLAEQLFHLNETVNHEIQQLNFTRTATREEIYRRLHIGRDYMISNLHRRIELDDTAAVAGFSSHHFLRVFREVFGKTPHAYLTMLRLKRAQKLLVDSEIPVTDVAAIVGFESLASFSLLFKKYAGVSPQQFRKTFCTG